MSAGNLAFWNPTNNMSPEMVHIRQSIPEDNMEGTVDFPEIENESNQPMSLLGNLRLQQQQLQHNPSSALTTYNNLHFNNSKSSINIPHQQVLSTQTIINGNVRESSAGSVDAGSIHPPRAGPNFYNQSV